MFTKSALLAQIKSTVARTTFLFGCIILLAFQSPAYGEVGDVRTELLKTLELQLAVADDLGLSHMLPTLEKAIEKVRFATDAELEPFWDTFDELQNRAASLERLNATIQTLKEERWQEQATGDAQFVAATSATTYGSPSPVSLTPAPYFDGGILEAHCRVPADATVGERNDTELVLDLKIALGAAKTLWAGMEVVCGLDLTAFASVGVVSAVCTGAAAGVAAAEEVLDAFLRCDATVDEAHLDAAFMRAEDNFLLSTDTHDDLTQHDTDIKALLTNIVNNQKIIIKLLKTPQGQRPGWKKQGYKK